MLASSTCNQSGGEFLVGVIIMRMILNGPIYDLLSTHITILGLIWEDVNVQSTM
jgi:hypothetical protein